MTFKTALVAAAFVATSGLAASATTLDLDLGDATFGANGAGTIAPVQTVDFIGFSLGAPSGFFMSSVDISVTSVAGSNLKEVIGLYSEGTLIASSPNANIGNGGSTATLSFSGESALGNGDYVLGFGGWKTFFTESIDDVTSTAFFNNGAYTVSIETEVSAVPLPAGGLLVLTGLGALSLKRRKRKS